MPALRLSSGKSLFILPDRSCALLYTEPQPGSGNQGDFADVTANPPLDEPAQRITNDGALAFLRTAAAVLAPRTEVPVPPESATVDDHIRWIYDACFGD